MKKESLLAQVNQPVLPTPTLLLRLHTEDWALLAIEFAHSAAGQVLDVTIKRRCSRTGSFSESGLSLFKAIGSGDPHCGDIDVRGCVDVEFWGVASGIGLTVTMAGLLVGIV